ncbi:MAG: DinB family protein [Betaproteobacteria bacterium]
MSVSPDRAATILARFNAVNHTLAARLRDLPAAAAERPPEDRAWSAAQIAWHVAQVNEWIAGVLTGSTATAKPAPSGFKESFDPSSLPAKITTAAALEPPPVVGRDVALERLRASGQHISKAIASLTPERGSGYCVDMRFGTLSLFELADFAAVHVTRHVAQIDRAVARV